jgi:hypothetical protein
MDNFKVAKIMLQKIRPRMHDENWLRASNLLVELSKKSVKDPERKKKLFCYFVDKIFEKEEEDEAMRQL